MQMFFQENAKKSYKKTHFRVKMRWLEKMLPKVTY